MKTVEDRYLTDPAFHNLVELLRRTLEQHEFTPSELREAAVLAATMHEMEHVRPIMVPRYSKPNQGTS